MTATTTEHDTASNRLQWLARYRAWHTTCTRERKAAVARARLLALRRKEMNWTWLSL